MRSLISLEHSGQRWVALSLGRGDLQIPSSSGRSLIRTFWVDLYGGLLEEVLDLSRTVPRRGFSEHTECNSWRCEGMHLIKGCGQIKTFQALSCRSGPVPVVWVCGKEDSLLGYQRERAVANRGADPHYAGLHFPQGVNPR